jgi:hypothetical protein
MRVLLPARGRSSLRGIWLSIIAAVLLLAAPSQGRAECAEDFSGYLCRAWRDTALCMESNCCGGLGLGVAMHGFGAEAYDIYMFCISNLPPEPPPFNPVAPATATASNECMEPSFIAAPAEFTRRANTSRTSTASPSGCRTLHAGIGPTPQAMSDESTPITGAAIEAHFPLGSLFYLKLLCAKQTTITSAFTLQSPASVTGEVDDPIFPGQIVVEFSPSKIEESKFFRAVHLGFQQLTITPTDGSGAVTVFLHIDKPAALGSAANDVDQKMIEVGNLRGIPPQFLKGQAEKESNFNRVDYRYEPITEDYKAYHSLAATVTNDNPPKKVIEVADAGRLSSQAPYADFRFPSLKPSAYSDKVYKGKQISELLATDYAYAQFGAALSQGSGTADAPDDVSARPFAVTKLRIPTPRGKMPNTILPASESQDRILGSAREIVNGSPKQNYLSGSVYARATLDEFNKHPDLLDFTAQTSLAATHGMFHVLYRAAIDLGWPGQNGNRGPGWLYDTTENWKRKQGSIYVAATKHLKEFRTHIARQLSPVFTDDDAFQTAFRVTIQEYNPGMRGYGQAVLGKSAAYLPKAAGAIFQ